MRRAVDLNECAEWENTPPRDVLVIQKEIDESVASDAEHFSKEFGIKITPQEILELERIHGVHKVLYAITNYPEQYREYLENPKAFPQKSSQISLFEANQK